MPVPANRELMVYYGPSYASDLGIDPDKQLTVYQIYKNPGEFSVPHFYYDWCMRFYVVFLIII